MIVAMAEMTKQHQELTREVNRRRHQQYGGERSQNLENEGVDNNAEEDKSKGIVTCRVLHLEREMGQMKRAMEEKSKPCG